MSTEATAQVTAPVELDLDGCWRLSPQVSIRPERFGALVYHFGTRKLSFLKHPTLLAVVEALATAPSAQAACDAAGVGVDELPRYQRALATLAASDTIRREVAA